METNVYLQNIHKCGLVSLIFNGRRVMNCLITPHITLLLTTWGTTPITLTTSLGLIIFLITREFCIYSSSPRILLFAQYLKIGITPLLIIFILNAILVAFK